MLAHKYARASGNRSSQSGQERNLDHSPTRVKEAETVFERDVLDGAVRILVRSQSQTLLEKILLTF